MQFKRSHRRAPARGRDGVWRWGFPLYLIGCHGPCHSRFVETGGE